MPRAARTGTVALLSGLLAIAVILFAGGGSAPAQDAMDELEGKLNELEDVQAKQGPLRAQLDAQNAEVDALIGRESELRQQEAAAQERLDEQQTKLDQATAELEAKQAELEAVQARLDRAVAHLSEMLVEIYKSGNPPDTLSVVLSSASWSDVLSETEYLDRIQNHDDALIARVEQLREQIEAVVGQLETTRAKIAAARNEIRAQRDELASARSQVEQRHAELNAARAERKETLDALLAREQELSKEIIPSSVPPGGKAALVDGEAIAPPDAPLAVKAAIAAANRINSLPYVWGGGHGSFDASGYDCSGAVSYALHGGGLLSSPLDSSAFMAYGAPGGGSWITVYAHSGHAFAVIAGLRFDTSGTGGSGPRWSTSMVSPSGFVARHPPGL